MASCKELFTAIYQNYDRRHGLLVECLALLTKMEEEFMVAATEETQDDVLDAPLTLDDVRDAQLHLDAVPDAQLHPVAVPCVQIHHDGLLPPTTTEEILVAMPETQLHLVGAEESKLVPHIERAEHVPAVVPFGAEHTLALAHRVFDGLPSTSHYVHIMFLGVTTTVSVDNKEEHVPVCFTVRTLVMVHLRCCCIWTTTRRWCVCMRLHAALHAGDSTGLWRPPWPPPAVEQLDLIILCTGLRIFWFAAASELLPFLVDTTTGYLALFTNDTCCVVVTEFALELAAKRNLPAKQFLLVQHHPQVAAPVSAGDESLGHHVARRLVQVGHREASNAMCSNNRFNAIPAYADARLPTDTTRGDWQFQGYIGLDVGTAPTTSITKPSGINSYTPALCSMKCLSSVIYVVDLLHVLGSLYHHQWAELHAAGQRGFQKMPEKDSVTYLAMMMESSWEGLHNEALELFVALYHACLGTNQFMLSSMLTLAAATASTNSNSNTCDTHHMLEVMLHSADTYLVECPITKVLEQYDEGAGYGNKFGFPLVSLAFSMIANGMAKCMDNCLLEQFWPSNLSVLAVIERVEELLCTTAKYDGLKKYIEWQIICPPTLSLGTLPFSQWVVVHDICVAKTNPQAPLGQVWLFVGGISTSRRAVWNIVKAEAYSMVAVFGVSTVRIAGLEGAKSASASRITSRILGGQYIALHEDEQNYIIQWLGVSCILGWTICTYTVQRSGSDTWTGRKHWLAMLEVFMVSSELHSFSCLTLKLSRASTIQWFIVGFSLLMSTFIKQNKNMQLQISAMVKTVARVSWFCIPPSIQVLLSIGLGASRILRGGECHGLGRQ